MTVRKVTCVVFLGNLFILSAGAGRAQDLAHEACRQGLFAFMGSLDAPAQFVLSKLELFPSEGDARLRQLLMGSFLDGEIPANLTYQQAEARALKVIDLFGRSEAKVRLLQVCHEYPLYYEASLEEDPTNEELIITGEYAIKKVKQPKYVDISVSSRPALMLNRLTDLTSPLPTGRVRLSRFRSEWTIVNSPVDEGTGGALFRGDKAGNPFNYWIGTATNGEPQYCLMSSEKAGFLAYYDYAPSENGCYMPKKIVSMCWTNDSSWIQLCTITDLDIGVPFSSKIRAQASKSRILRSGKSPSILERQADVPEDLQRFIEVFYRNRGEGK